MERGIRKIVTFVIRYASKIYGKSFEALEISKRLKLP